MDFTCTAGQFGTEFKSIRFGVKLSTTTDPTGTVTSLWTKSRYERKLSANTPGGLLTHPSSFRHDFESVRASVKLSSSTASVWYYELRSHKVLAQNETECQAAWKDFACALAYFRVRSTLSQSRETFLHISFRRLQQTPRGRNRDMK